MKIIHSDIRHGEAKIKVEQRDDLWYLRTLIEEGDSVQGQTVRKIRIGEEGQTPKIVKKAIFLKIRVEKVEFSKQADTLRVLGTVIDGPEDVPRGEHHSFAIDDGTVITIIKERWLSYHLERLREASTTQASKTLICVFDREEAYFALMKRYGHEVLSHIHGTVEKKAEKVPGARNFYEEIIIMLLAYVKQYSLDHIIMASPAFWKEEFAKHLKDAELKKRIILTSCSSCDPAAINEILQRKEVEQALREDRVVQETKLVEQLLTEIGKGGGLAAYGMVDVGQKAAAGAVGTLMVTDSRIQGAREAGEYGKLEQVMRAVEDAKGKVHLITSEHECGKKLDGLGGIGAILRYKTDY